MYIYIYIYMYIYIYVGIISGLGVRHFEVSGGVPSPPEQPPGNRFKQLSGRLAESKTNKRYIHIHLNIQIPYYTYVCVYIYIYIYIYIERERCIGIISYARRLAELLSWCDGAAAAMRAPAIYLVYDIIAYLVYLAYLVYFVYFGDMFSRFSIFRQYIRLGSLETRLAQK